MKNIHIFAFAGPSGSGKTEIVKALRQHAPDHVTMWQQVTTRQPRTDNEDYLFLTKDQFKDVQSGLTCVTLFNGESYGTFPEIDESNTSKAVLTVVDSVGLQSLYADVYAHDKALSENRETPIFPNDCRIHIHSILMQYQLNEESIAARANNRRRSIETIQSEMDRLTDVMYKVQSFHKSNVMWTDIIDNTHQWSDPAKVFADLIAPTIGVAVAQPLMPIYDRFDRLVKLCNNEQINYLLDLLDQFSDAINPLVDIQEKVLVDSENCYDPLNDHAEEGTQPLSALDHVNDVQTKSDASENKELESFSVEAALKAEEISPEEVTDLDQPVQAAVPTPAASIFKAIDFEDWVLEEGLGAQAFKGEFEFGSAFRQYLSASGGDPNGISVSQQTTLNSDAKGGRIIQFTARGEFWTYQVEYNERLRRVVHTEIL